MVYEHGHRERVPVKGRKVEIVGDIKPVLPKVVLHS